ncbi:DUF2931 family protein [Rahnella sikkimica]|uniref:DUF2931 domain-containing protein n=1 Tax=Rahnella sikkimica TaxID=1805933 RepID=A0A2L1UPW4_9GAMM|nr:DUF2931 family protein [Rahnella sikkimica]AVF34970.1 hypothetical protein BV494_08485 [Rahnella sikkimica]
MVLKGITSLLFVLSLTGCHSQAAQQTQGRSAPVAEGDWSLPYGKWEFAFLTPEALPATVTHVRIVDTAGYLNTFTRLDGTHQDPNIVGRWSDKSRSGTVNFNKASHPPQYMVFCWDSIIDMKTYETSLFFPQEVWEKMRTPASHKARSGNTVWYKTMLFGLAPEGKVRVWLQDVGDYPNYPVPVIKLQTLSGDKLDVCKGITKSDFTYGYDQDIKDFIKGKTYPYGAW